MGKRTAALVVSGALVVAAAGAVVITPASAATSDNPVTSRLAGIKSALSGLVDDGTITQEQADKVAETLDEQLPHRRGGMEMMMHGLDAAAEVLNMTSDELRDALMDGQSLADIAGDQSVSVDDLIASLVASAEADLATAVDEGRLTRAQADRIGESLKERITDRVNGVRPDHRFGRGFHGPSDLPGGQPQDDSGAPATSSTSTVSI